MGTSKSVAINLKCVFKVCDDRIERDQVEALLEVMVQGTKLKSIKMNFSDVYQYENSLVVDARRTGVAFIIDEADE